MYLSSLAAVSDDTTVAVNGSSTSYLSVQNIPIGFVPDYTLGSRTPMGDLNTALNASGFVNASTFGWYAQTYPNETFDGSQLMAIKSDIVASGAILEAAIMPEEAWTGYTTSDNFQAKAVAKILREFTDLGVEVRLRFAHEVNYYTTTAGGSRYGGGDTAVDDFKEAFSVVHSACQELAPDVKLVYCPSAATLEDYETWAPDASTYDFVAVDYYPTTTKATSVKNYLSAIKPFHDKFTVGTGKKFIIAEAGVHYNTSAAARVRWLQELTSPQMQAGLPNLVSVTWYNSVGGSSSDQYVYAVLEQDQDEFNEPLMDFLAQPSVEVSSATSYMRMGKSKRKSWVVGVCAWTAVVAVVLSL